MRNTVVAAYSFTYSVEKTKTGNKENVWRKEGESNRNAIHYWGGEKGFSQNKEWAPKKDGKCKKNNKQFSEGSIKEIKLLSLFNKNGKDGHIPQSWEEAIRTNDTDD